MSSTIQQVGAADFPDLLKAAFKRAEQADIAVAFVTKPGLDFANLKSDLKEALTRGSRIRLLVDLSTGATDPSAIWDLIGLTEAYPGRLELRAVLPEGESVLHAKFYLFRGAKQAVVATGSANWSKPAFGENLEHGLVVTAPKTDDPLIREGYRFFEGVWNSKRARTIDREAARLYEEFCGRRRSAEERARKRSRAAWFRLANYLQQAHKAAFAWPSVDAAYLMGVITARGTFVDDSNQIIIRLGFRKNRYKDGKITVGKLSFSADEKLPTISKAIQNRIKALLPEATLQLSDNMITIDCPSRLYHQVRDPFVPRTDPSNFRLPQKLTTASDDVIQEFMKGFAVACALITNHTSLPGNKITGGHGIMTVWLRPRTPPNWRLFDELKELIERRLDIKVFEHRRKSRESHLKIRCESFTQIGFGIDWWDALVEEGARYNEALFPQS